MAPPLQSSLPALDTMTSELSSEAEGGLGELLFHTDLTITSVEKRQTKDITTSPGPNFVDSNSQSPEDVARQQRAADTQMWWDEAITKYMDLPDGYVNVAVLLVKWEDELDDLKTRDEVSLGHRSKRVIIY